MASLKEVKRRISTVNNTRKITSAMKMVASAKLHKAQASITNMLPYEQHLSGLLTKLLRDSDKCLWNTPRKEVRRVALVVCSSNTSLCGGFNVTIIKHTLKWIEEHRVLGVGNLLLYPIGKKVADALQKQGFSIQGDFQHLADKPSFNEVSALAQHLMELFSKGEVDRVELLYNHFKSMASQVLTHEVYLPMPTSGTQSASNNQADYILEPSREELLAMLLPKVLRLKLYTVLLDSNTSEHASRTMAMQIATDNADGLLQELTLMYNKTRQQAITSELLDIVGGSMM